MADTLHYVGRARFAPVRTREQIYESLAWPYLAAVPFMYATGLYVQMKKMFFGMFNAKPNTNCWFVDGLSVNSRRMKDGATRWPSLNTCYNFKNGEGATAAHRVVDLWWMQIRNAQAVRNRLKIAKSELRTAVRTLARPGNAVRILSLAAGTAQGVIEVAAECNKLIGDFKADIVEMMGLLDYLRESLAHPLIRKIRLHLAEGGYFFCCHIHPNSERYFLKYVVNWDSGMLYRTRDEFADVLHQGGFLTPALLTEPHGIHSVSVARKN